jgi:hypothetical protein
MKLKMSKPNAKTQKPQPVVTLTIVIGPMSPAQRQTWKWLWTKLIASAKREAEF